MNAKQHKAEDAPAEDNAAEGNRPTCGIIMPIADMPGYEPDHWSRVKRLIVAAAEMSGFSSRIVSESENIGVIHSRIVTNIHDDPIVVCDVSGKNANVMFELGMRLAFDKPAIIIIDEKTGYSFDTSPIEHISYRSDMRYHDTIDFIKKLAEKIAATHKKSIEDKYYSPFLKEFRRYKVADLKEENVSIKEYLDRILDSLQKSVERSNSKLSSFKIGDNWDSGKSWTDVFHMSPSAESKVLVDTINKIFDTGNYTSEDEAYKSAIRILPLFGVDVNQRHVQELIRKQMDDHIFF